MSGIVNALGSVSGKTAAGARTGGGVPAGTKQLFHQSSAPTGWTKLTATGTGSASVNDVSFRVITGNVTDGVGGSVAMTTAFASQAVASHTNAENEIPAHVHYMHGCVSGPAHQGGRPGHSTGSNLAPLGCNSCSKGGGGGHTHTAINLAVKYVDIIVAEKD
jgi:hypothetical protein